LVFIVVCYMDLIFFFFYFFFFSSRRRHTRFACDWSSDVCSSDLERARVLLRGHLHAPLDLAHGIEIDADGGAVLAAELVLQAGGLRHDAIEDAARLLHDGGALEIGRASCRERVMVGGGGVVEEEY